MSVFEAMETVVQGSSRLLDKLGDCLIDAIGIFLPLAVIAFAWLVIAAVAVWAWNVIF